MKKNLVILGLFVAILAPSMASVSAQDAVFINDLGKLQYSTSHVVEPSATLGNTFQSANSVVNAVNQMSNEAAIQAAGIKSEYAMEDDMTVPASSKAQYGFNKGNVDTSSYYYDDTPYSGVNASKTIYTDDLGRLHFFGKGNLIKGERNVYTTESEQ